MKKLFFLLALVLVSLSSYGQMTKKTTSWTFDVSKTEVNTGDEIELIFKVRVIDDWYIYSSDIPEGTGPNNTIVVFEENGTFEVVGDLIPINPEKKFDNIWDADVTFFVGNGEFRQKIKVLKKDLFISGTLDFQTCTDVDGLCIPF